MPAEQDPAATGPFLATEITSPHPVDLALSLGQLQRGRNDPCVQVSSDGTVLRATWTPLGAASGRYRPLGHNRISVEAYGPGAAYLMDNAGDLLGFADDHAGFEPKGLVAELHKRFSGMRFIRTRAVHEAMVRSVTEQKVTGADAKAAYRALLAFCSEPAPGPLGLTLPPHPHRLAQLPFHDYHRANLEERRARVIRTASQRADALERTTDMPLAQAWRALLSLHGVGPWTVAEVAQVAWGDADAVSVGDYHLPHLVSFVFTGERKGTDQRMLELLEPFKGHRGRVVRLLMAAGLGPERRGPRMSRRIFKDQ